MFLNKNPVVFTKDQGKAYSASDGGFYGFKGKIRQYDDSLVAQLLLVDHDYVLIPYRIFNLTGRDSTLSLEELVKRGKAEIDSSFLKKSYQVKVFPDHIVMDSVYYRLK